MCKPYETEFFIASKSCCTAMRYFRKLALLSIINASCKAIHEGLMRRCCSTICLAVLFFTLKITKNG